MPLTKKPAETAVASRMVFWLNGCIYINATLLALVGLFFFSTAWATKNSTDWWLAARDPLLGISNRTMLVVAAVFHTAIAAYLFAARDLSSRSLTALWMGINHLVYYAGIHMLKLSAMPNTERFLGWRLSVQSVQVDFRWKLLMAYLIVTGTVLLILVWHHSRKIGKEMWFQQWLTSRMEKPKEKPVASKKVQSTEGYAKTICPQCGQKIAFPLSRVGESLPCPHCAATLTLVEPPRTI